MGAMIMEMCSRDEERIRWIRFFHIVDILIMVLIGFAPLLAAKLLLPDAPGTWLVGGVGLIVWDGLLRLIFGVWFKCFFLPMWVWGAFFAAGGLFDF